MTTETALLGPTPQRLARAFDADIPITDSTRRRRAFRLIGVVEGMARQGKLKKEQVEAFGDFEKDLSHAFASGSVVVRYGEQSGSGGTPVSQLASHLLGPEKRADACASLALAARQIGEPRTLETLLAIAMAEATLEIVGRTILMIGNKTAAIAAAQRTVQIGTYSLAVHYGRTNPPSRASPA